MLLQRKNPPAHARGLPPQAYETIPGDEYPPYVPPEQEFPGLHSARILNTT